jgi:tetratricopeptide (TPR) repeat protein
MRLPPQSIPADNGLVDEIMSSTPVPRSLFSVSLCVFACLAMAASSSSLNAAPQTIPGLGTTAFPVSTGVPAARDAFLRGLLLLHLFEYADAADSFVAAQKLDPAFALAYWGEAMTFNHGVWNQVDPAAGKAALEKFAATPAARAARVSDAREKAYLTAVEILYDGTGTKTERDKRYASAMERLSASYSADRDAQLFYALALLSQSEGVRDVPVYLKAAGISKAVFRLEPGNPGAVHYWIHGMDDPEHAAGALEAARALSKIAPDAPHAQHMCSHIFMALGMWDDVVQANVEAIRVGNQHDQAAGFPAYNCGHYAEWLEYGYFQQGRLHEAQQMVNACRQTDTDATAWVAAHPGRVPFGAKDAARVHRRLLSAFADMQNMAVIESQDWKSAEEPASTLSALPPYSAAWCEFASGFAAAQSGHVGRATAALQSMQTKAAEFQATPEADAQDAQALAVAAGTLSGLIQVKSGRGEAGEVQIRHAYETYCAMAFAFGPPVTIKPPEELLGEILLAKGDAAAARLSFEQALQRAPGRAQSLLGLARAERLAHDEPAARKTYEKLVAIWHAAAPDVPGLAEARMQISRARASNHQ